MLSEEHEDVNGDARTSTPREHTSNKRIITINIKNTVLASRGDASIVGAENMPMSASEKDSNSAAINSAGKNNNRTGKNILVNPFQTSVARGNACSKGRR